MEEVADSGLIKHVEADFADGVGSGGHDFLFGLFGSVGKHDFTVCGLGRFAHFLFGVLEIADADCFADLHEGDLLFWFGW